MVRLRVWWRFVLAISTLYSVRIPGPRGILKINFSEFPTGRKLADASLPFGRQIARLQLRSYRWGEMTQGRSVPGARRQYRHRGHSPSRVRKEPMYNRKTVGKTIQRSKGLILAAKRRRGVGIDRRKELNDERSRNVYENKESNDALPENKATFLRNCRTFYTNARVFSRIRRPYCHFQSADAGIRNVQTRFAGIPAGAGVMARNAQGEMCNGPRARKRVRAIAQRPPRITHDNKDGDPAAYCRDRLSSQPGVRSFRVQQFAAALLPASLFAGILDRTASLLPAT